MNFTFAHNNFNVTDINRSVEFYKEALGLSVIKENRAADGSFQIAFLSDASDSVQKLELTYLRDHPQKYDLGENEIHLAFVTDDYAAAHALHKKMGCICYENTAMGIYFIEDPDGYWVEIVPVR